MYGGLRKFLYDHRYFLLLMGAVFFFCIGPLLYMHTAIGNDGLFHMGRIYSISTEIRQGNFFSRIYYAVMDGNGYASPLFYGDIFLYFPAVLHACGMSLFTAYDIFQACIYFAVAISMYLCTYNVLKDKQMAFFGAFMLTISSYLCTDVVSRAAIGEAQAFIFLPLVFAGYYHIMYLQMKQWYLLPLGLAGIVFSHTLSAAMTVLLLVGFFLFSIKRIFAKPKRLRYLIVSALVFFVLSADLLFPMLEQLMTSSFRANDGYAATRWGTLTERSLPVWGALFDFNVLTPAYDQYTIPNGVGLAIVVLTGAMIFWRRPKDGFITKSIVFSYLALFATTAAFPWRYLQRYVGVLQFPWRLLILPTFLTAMAGAMYFHKAEKGKTRKTLMIIVLCLSTFSYLTTITPKAVQNHQAILPETRETSVLNYLGAWEYLPTLQHEDEKINAYRKTLAELSDTVTMSDGVEATLHKSHGKAVVEFSASDADGWVEVPFLMYRGYTATLQDGTKLPCTYGHYNRVRVLLNDAQEGTLTVQYTGTAIQHISRVVCMVGWGTIAAYLVLIHRKKKDAG